VTDTLRDARTSAQDRDWIRATYRDYLSELSVSKTGLFPALGEWASREAEFLAGWFTDHASHPFVILNDGARVGFALVTRPMAGDRHRLSEFFIVAAARRLGIGRSAATLLMTRFAGEWEIVEDEHNRPALAFWRNVIAALTQGRYRETRIGGEVRHVFQVAGRPAPHPAG
jgi:predicted acetyltransferase